jgi:hypothetical protein
VSEEERTGKQIKELTRVSSALFNSISPVLDFPHLAKLINTCRTEFGLLINHIFAYLQSKPLKIKGCNNIAIISNLAI